MATIKLISKLEVNRGRLILHSVTKIRTCFIQDCQIFLAIQHTNTKKLYPMTTKCTKWPEKIPNAFTLFQMAIKYTAQNFVFKGPPKFPQIVILN
jgi:hypothetical protein